MNSDRDTTRIVRSWLDEGVTELPDRVLDAVLDQIPATHQRRATRWPARRLQTMNFATRLGIAAAVVAVTAILGYSYFVAPNVGAPDQSVPPSAPESREATVLPPSGTTLQAGSYRISDPDYTTVTTEFVVPEGWVANHLGGIAKNPDGPTEVGMVPFIVTHVYRDACESEGTLVEIGPTADDLVDAMLNQQNTPAVGPADLTIGGYPAQRVDLGYPTQADTTTCRHGDELIQIWADEAETTFFAVPPGYYHSVYVVDVNGERVVLVTGHGPQSTDEDRAEVREILATIRFPDEP